MSEDIRCFIALGMDHDLQKKIALIQHDRFKNDRGVKWVKPENAHLTLKFLGNLGSSKLNKVVYALEEMSVTLTSTNVLFNRIGAFPNNKNPQIIWLGTEDAPEIDALQQKIEENLHSIGIERETRDFKTHVTLGRIKHAKCKRFISSVLKDGLSELPFHTHIQALTLYKSILTPQGPQYENLFEKKLG